MEKEPILLINSGFGVYIPQMFIETANEEILNQISEEIKTDLLDGPDNEFYWDSWDSLLNITFLIGGQEFIVYQNEDLWLVPMEYTNTQAFEKWTI